MKWLRVTIILGSVGMLAGCLGPWNGPGPSSPELYVATGAGLVAIFPSGTSHTLIAGCPSHSLHIHEGELYAKCSTDSIQVLDLEGNYIRSISVPDQVPFFLNFAVVDRDKLALFDNRADAIYFIDASGNLLATVTLPPSPGSYQALNGVMAEEKLVVLDSVLERLFLIDPQIYQIFTLFNLSIIPEIMLVVDYADGEYYVAGDYGVYRVDIREGVPQIASLDGRITALKVQEERAYVGVHLAGEIYSVDLSSSEAQLFASGLDGVLDLEVAPQPPEETE